MRVLPVIDLLAGQVVHAVRGERDQYRPLQSTLCTSAKPADVARALVLQFKFTYAYVADLDAIQGQAVQWNALGDVYRAGLRLWLDAGLKTIADLENVSHRLARHSIRDTAMIIGLETWRDPGELKTAVEFVGTERIVFSLDLRGDATLAADARWPTDVLRIAQCVLDSGIKHLLLLDLAAVGTSEGPPILGLCTAIKGRWPDVTLAGGGGIRDRHDILRLSEAGCDVALVATALHRGELTAKDMQVVFEG